MPNLGLYTYKDMQDQVGQYVQDTSADRLTRIKDSLNRRYFDAWTRHDWSRSMAVHEGEHSWNTYAAELANYASLTVSKVEASGYQALPPDVAEIVAIYQGALDTATPPAPIRMQRMALEEFYTCIAFDPDKEGDPQVWTQVGYTPLNGPILVNEKLAIQSGQAADNAQNVQIWGQTAGLEAGTERTEALTLTGTNARNTSLTWNAGWSIKRIAIEGGATGTITIKGATSNQVYALIFEGPDATNREITVQRPLIRVWPLPTAQTTIRILYKRILRQLVNDEDIPEIPVGRYMVEAAIGDIYEQQRNVMLAQFHLSQADFLLNEAIMDDESRQRHMSRPASHREEMNYRSRYYSRSIS